MIKKILFDIDGTLICNVDYIKYSQAAFYEFGIHDDAAIWTFNHSYEAYETAIGRYNRELFAKYMSNRIKWYLNQEFVDLLFKHLGKAVNGDPDELKKMLDRFDKYELVIVSNFFEQVQKDRLTTLGINEYFTSYHGEDACKPRLKPFIEALGDTYPDECLMVGDRYDIDIKPAKTLGINTLQVGRDIKSVLDLTPEYIEDIEEHLKKKNL